MVPAEKLPTVVVAVCVPSTAVAAVDAGELMPSSTGLYVLYVGFSNTNAPDVLFARDCRAYREQKQYTSMPTAMTAAKVPPTTPPTIWPI